jgi:hypothetical protein
MAGTSPAMTKSVVQLDRIMHEPPLAVPTAARAGTLNALAINAIGAKLILPLQP